MKITENYNKYQYSIFIEQILLTDTAWLLGQWMSVGEVEKLVL